MSGITDRLTRREILKATGAGALGTAALSGTASANCDGPCTPVTLGKLDSAEINELENGTTSEFTLTLDGDLRDVENCAACQGDKDVTVRVTPTAVKDGGEDEEEEEEEDRGRGRGRGRGDDEREDRGRGHDEAVDGRYGATVADGERFRTDGGDDGEVTCVELEILDNNGKCKCADDGLYLSGAEVKGGPETATYDCGDEENRNQEYSRIPDACAPTNDRNGKRYGISNIVVEVCVFPNCYRPGQTNCAKGGGG
ncbi:hypothetical protein [Haloplanus pelagicus]|jgi:hypothetical protein|uniref:hypothetical protein n=1 Tax=Haloplanus pelagicus TaxID=2949995 RepID=UPI0020404DE4|nr:hypothetical protein [Haloplanus sp. HW8-1]